MENQKKLLKEIMNLGVLYLLFITVLYYFFVTHDQENATKIFMQAAAGIGFLFIIYWTYSLEIFRGKISNNFISFFRLSFLLLALSVLFIGLVSSGKVSSVLIGDMILKFIMFSVLYPAALPILHLIYVGTIEVINFTEYTRTFMKMKNVNKMSLLGNVLNVIGISFLTLVLFIMIFFKLAHGAFEWNLIFLLFVYILFMASIPLTEAYSKELFKRKLKESENLLHLNMSQALAYSIFGFGVGITFVFNGLDVGKWYNIVIGLIILSLAFFYFAVGYQRRFFILHDKYSKEKSI